MTYRATSGLISKEISSNVYQEVSKLHQRGTFSPRIIHLISIGSRLQRARAVGVEIASLKKRRRLESFVFLRDFLNNKIIDSQIFLGYKPKKPLKIDFIHHRWLYHWFRLASSNWQKYYFSFIFFSEAQKVCNFIYIISLNSDWFWYLDD